MFQGVDDGSVTEVRCGGMPMWGDLEVDDVVVVAKAGVLHWGREKGCLCLCWVLCRVPVASWYPSFRFCVSPGCRVQQPSLRVFRFRCDRSKCLSCNQSYTKYLGNYNNMNNQMERLYMRELCKLISLVHDTFIILYFIFLINFNLIKKFND